MKAGLSWYRTVLYIPGPSDRLFWDPKRWFLGTELATKHLARRVHGIESLRSTSEGTGVRSLCTQSDRFCPSGRTTGGDRAEHRVVRRQVP